MKTLAKAPLPKAVIAVADRIGLEQGIDSKAATRKYVEETQPATRIDFDQLRNTYYSLTETRTKKASGSKNEPHKHHSLKNCLKLNSKLRKTLYKLTGEEKQRLRYSVLEGVHEMWQQYSAIILEKHSNLDVFRMDLHGCELKCTASKNPTLVGCEGIVVEETKNTFLIIKSTNRFVTLPKRESIFEFRAGQRLFRIHGCNLLFTAQTRAKVKFKQMKCWSDI